MPPKKSAVFRPSKRTAKLTTEEVRDLLFDPICRRDALAEYGIVEEEQIRPHNTTLQSEEALTDLGFVCDTDGSLRFEDILIAPPPIPAIEKVQDERLIIKHIDVTNFKSYGGNSRIGPFDKNFTAVVGPNGSGKSNVIDALMFVFGRKSRDIRAKKLTNLVHNSDMYPDCTSCSVIVSFSLISDKTGIFVPDSGFTISRTVHTDGSAHYEKDYQRKTYKEIVTFLRTFGIDMEYNRFLIMQGEIEQIALMPPKATPKDSVGFLEYIEDIVGTHRYIEPIKFFKEKAEAMKEHERTKAQDVSMFEKAKKELEAPKNKALSYLRLDNKKVLCQNSILHHERKKKEKALEEAVKEKEKFAEKVKSLKAEMAELREEKKKIETENSNITSKSKEINDKLEKCREEFNKLVQDDAENIVEIKFVKGKIQSNEKLLEDADKEMKKLNKQLGIYESETDELQKRKDKLEKELSVEDVKSTEAMGNLKAETQNMQEQKDALEESLIKLKNNVNEKKSEMDLIKSELSILESNGKQEKEKLSSLESNLKRYEDSAKKEDDLMREEKKQLAEIDSELTSLKEQLSQAKQKGDALVQQGREARQKLEEAKMSQQSSRNDSSLLKGLLRAKAKGELPPGIYGRLGNLGAIDQKYDIAMSTACTRLDNIVTDTLETAQECVNYLKKYNLGYATFIALDQQKKFERIVDQRIPTPENVKRLFDLIKVNDPALRTAFYFAIRDTLVADNLEQATRIGLGGSIRYRVVTLNGKLVEPSGAMIGGGKEVAKGKMGQKVVENACSDEELREMSARSHALEKELTDVKESIASLTKQISQRSSKLSSLPHSLKKRRQNLNSFNEQVEMLTSQIAEQEKRMEGTTVDEKKVLELEEKIKQKNKIYKKAAEETSVVEKKVSELQEKILELSKGKMTKAKKTMDKMQKKLSEVTSAITASTVNIRRTKDKITKLEKEIKGFQVKLVNNKKEHEDKAKKREDLTEKGRVASDTVQVVEKEQKEIADQGKNFAQQLSEINKKEQDLKKKDVDQKNEMKELEAKESGILRRIKKISENLSNLKLSVVEEDPTEIPALSDEEIEELDINSLEGDLELMVAQLAETTPNVGVIAEFKKKDDAYRLKHNELQVMKEARVLEERRKIELDKRRLREFMKAFSFIGKKVKEVYNMLTDSGDADLEMVNKRNPFDKGIVYTVRPPKKAWKHMTNLSGGEKTLSSLALVFSLHYFRTTPFYVMDEIDAALDERNVAIIGKYLMEMQKNAQFIIVSLRNVMNELPSKLLGVFKVDNCTRNIHLNNVDKWAKKKTVVETEPPTTESPESLTIEENVEENGPSTSKSPEGSSKKKKGEENGQSTSKSPEKSAKKKKANEPSPSKSTESLANKKNGEENGPSTSESPNSLAKKKTAEESEQSISKSPKRPAKKQKMDEPLKSPDRSAKKKKADEPSPSNTPKRSAKKKKGDDGEPSTSKSPL